MVVGEPSFFQRRFHGDETRTISHSSALSRDTRRTHPFRRRARFAMARMDPGRPPFRITGSAGNCCGVLMAESSCKGLHLDTPGGLGAQQIFSSQETSAEA